MYIIYNIHYIILYYSRANNSRQCETARILVNSWASQVADS